MPGLESIVLGTVQLGLAYGRRSCLAPLDAEAAYRILDKAWDLGIRAFDTAETYGAASGRLARWLHDGDRIQQCNVITKIVLRECADLAQVQHACARFAGARSIMLLAHDMVDRETFGALRDAASEHGAESGVSIYLAEEVMEASRYDVTRVQGPGSIVDLRQLEAARRSGVHLDARSVFLQGILLDDFDTAERRVPGMGEVSLAVARAALDAGLDPAAAVLASMLRKIGPRDRLVLGFDEVDQLECIPRALAADLDAVAAFDSFFVDRCPTIPSKALDPRTW